MFYVFLFILSFFAVIGFFCLLRAAVRIFSRPVEEREIILIEPIGENQKNAEFVLRSAAGRVMWMGRFAPDRVICLDCGMDNETRKLCTLVTHDYPFMEICTKNEIQSRIAEL
jgi:hypothetical protein